MRDELDHDVQQWFKRSEEKLPPQPFTLQVLKRMHATERRLRLQRYVGLFVAVASFGLLLPQLAVLARSLVGAGDMQGSLLVLMLAGFAYAVLRQAREAGLLDGR